MAGPKLKDNLQLIGRQLTIAGLNGLGGVSFLLILYGIASKLYPNWQSAVDQYAPVVSVWLTMVGVAVTACTVWFPVHNRPPDVHSKLIIAPIMTGLVLLVLCYMSIYHKQPPDYVVNGFALLGLLGAIFRALPFSEEQGLRKRTSTLEGSKDD